MTSQYGVYALNAGLARLHARMDLYTPTHPGTNMHARASMHTQTSMQYLLLFHSDNGFVNAPQGYVFRTLPVLFVMLPTRSNKMASRVLNPTWRQFALRVLRFLQRYCSRMWQVVVQWAVADKSKDGDVSIFRVKQPKDLRPSSWAVWPSKLHVPEDLNLQQQSCENLKPCIRK